MLFIWWFLFNYSYILNCGTHHGFWSALYQSNNTVLYFFSMLFVLALILFSGLQLYRQNVTISSEYLIFVCLIIFSSYILISSSNLFLTIFLLEVIALLIFGKFTVTRLFTNNNLAVTSKTNSLFLNQFSYGLFNSLFFQFWANFVSSTCLFFSLINLHYSYGTSNFFMLNFFFSVVNSNWYVPEIFNSFNLIVLITGFFIKLGLSPYQFFKIETYKGIPVYTVIVYTTLYLAVYIYFFIYLFIYQVPFIRDSTNMYVLMFVALSVLYVFSLLFDTKNFKAFLSYSTLITVLNILLVVLTI